MVFSSYIFLYLFLPAFLATYYLCPRGGKSFALAAWSFVFYGWWRPDFCVLMVASIALDYACGRGIATAREKGGRGRGWLLASMVGNLGMLGYFKYANFGVAQLNALLAAFGVEGVSWTSVVLPVGISFYTFQTMSYTIDVYRGAAPRQTRIVDFTSYVVMFPQLVAGPIVRYGSVADQIVSRTHTFAKLYAGVLMLQCGLAKKILVADPLANLADQAFGGAALGAADAWIGAAAYAFQIYFDFSGYSDMAIGLGLMIGFRFPTNFDGPYRSVGITDFWRRWHVSLSTWLRDYLYVPLGGNRRGRARTYVNLALVMLLGGLWHGANWTFVAWGAYQGAWLIFERALGGRALWSRAPAPLRIALTFVVVVVGWVFFRATDMAAAGAYLASLIGVSGAPPALDVRPLHLVALGVGAVVVWALPTSQALLARGSRVWALALQPCFLLALVHLHYQDHVPFLYFQF